MAFTMGGYAEGVKCCGLAGSRPSQRGLQSPRLPAMSKPEPPFSLPVVLLQLLDGAGAVTPAALASRLASELPEYAAMKPSSIYRALSSLKGNGWVDSAPGKATGKGRPPVDFFLTDAGRAEAEAQRKLAGRLFGGGG